MSEEENNTNESTESTHELERVRWEGKTTSPIGKTPFGFFDSDPQFTSFAPKAADWAAKRLGYPIVDIEMIDVQFYACFEEAVTEYSAQVNQFSIKQNLYSLRGTSTSVNLTTSVLQTQPLPFYLKLSEAYGAEVGAGGNVDWRKQSLQVKTGVQTYDLQGLFDHCYKDAKTGQLRQEKIEVKRIFHEAPPSLNRIYDPMASGMSHQNIMNEFGWGNMSVAGSQFLLRPLNEDLMRLQAIEFNESVRRSAYSFELINNKLTIFPIPEKDYTLWFDYVFKRERDIAAVQGYVDAEDFNVIPKSQTEVVEETTEQVVIDNATGPDGTSSDSTSPTPSGDSCGTESGDCGFGVDNGVTDFSNVPYQFHNFATINDVGKRWIMKYYLALCKELLGSIRAKYQSIPIPGGETSLDGDTLRSEATSEKEQLITELREDLEVTSRSTTSESLNQISDNLQENLRKVPNFLYIG
jgi:hypothetical protein